MNSSGDEGFTLVEMLVTLAIVSVVFALLSSVVGFGRDVLGKTTSNSTRLDDIALIRRLLTDTLSQVVVTDRVALSGTHNHISTVAYGPQALGLEAPTETTFEPASDGRGLLVRWTAANGGKGVSRRVLYGDSDVTFSYFSSDRGWAPAWENSGFLPDLVRIQIRREPDVPPTGFSVEVKRLSSPSCLLRSSGHCAASK